MVEVVLNPYSEDAVAQKEKQMRELAIINGAREAAARRHHAPPDPPPLPSS